MNKIIRSFLWLIELLVGLLFIAAVLVFLLPWLFKFDGTRAAILKLLRQPLKADLSIEKMEIGWWSPTRLEGIHYKTLDQRMESTISSIDTPSSLWTICFGTHDIGKLSIEKPIITFTIPNEHPEESAPKEPATFQTAGPPELSSLNLKPVIQKLTPRLSGTVVLSDGAIYVYGEEIEPIAIEDLSLQMSLSKNSGNLQFSLTGNTKYGKHTGSLSSKGSFGPLESPDPILSTESYFAKLPVFAIDQLIAFFYPSWTGAVYSAIGPTLDLEVKGDLSKEDFDLSLTGSSAQFNCEMQLFSQNGQIILSRPAEFSLTVNAFLAEKFFSLSPYLRALRLASSPRLLLEVSDFSIPFQAGEGQWQTSAIRGELTVLDMEFSTPIILQGIALEKFTASFNTDNLQTQLLFDAATTLRFGDKKTILSTSGELSTPLASFSPLTIAFSAEEFPVGILDQVMKTSSFLQDSIGTICNFTGAIDKTSEGRRGILYFHSPTIDIENANFHLLDDRIVLIDPIHLLFSPSKMFWEKYAGGVNIASFDILLEKLDYPFEGTSQLQAQGIGKGPQIAYKHFSLLEPSIHFDIQTFLSISLKGKAEGVEALAKLAWDKQKSTLALLEPFRSSFAISPEKTSKLWQELELSPWTEGSLVFDFWMNPFTTSLGQNFLRNVHIEGGLTAPIFAIQSKDSLHAMLKDTKALWNLDTRAGKFFAKIDAMGGCQENALTPIHAEILTTRLFFQPKRHFDEMETIAKISFDKLDSGFFDTWDLKRRFSSFFGAWISAKGEFSIKPDYTSANFDVSCEKGSAQAKLKQGLTKPDNAFFDLTLKTSFEEAKAGNIDMRCTVGNILHSEQGWDFSHTTADLLANFQFLPTAFLDTIGLTGGLKKGIFSSLLGTEISGKLSANLKENTGPFLLTINSASANVSLNGKIQNGTLLLNEPFFAQLSINEEMSRVFLKDVNPLSITAVQSDGPMTLLIEKQGFSLPLLPWNLQKATIPKARIEVGKLLCRNEGNIHVALGLLKLGQFSKSHTLKLWFAPMDLSVSQGVIDCQRTEILVADSIEIATWGKIFLENNQVDAVLGLTAQALGKAFGITGLPDNYVLQLPMRGTIDDLSIDTSKATSKIAALLAWQNAAAAGGLLGGPQGALIGGLLGQIGKQLPDGGTSAPPAKHPFPWEGKQTPASSLPPKKRKSAIKPGDKPLKQLLKLFK